MGQETRTCASIAPRSSRDTSRGSGSTRDTEPGKISSLADAPVCRQATEALESGASRAPEWGNL
jgi:hypothetical protein